MGLSQMKKKWPDYENWLWSNGKNEKNGRQVKKITKIREMEAMGEKYVYSLGNCMYNQPLHQAQLWNTPYKERKCLEMGLGGIK